MINRSTLGIAATGAAAVGAACGTAVAAAAASAGAVAAASWAGAAGSEAAGASAGFVCRRAGPKRQYGHDANEKTPRVCAWMISSFDLLPLTHADGQPCFGAPRLSTPSQWCSERLGAYAVSMIDCTRSSHLGRTSGFTTESGTSPLSAMIAVSIAFSRLAMRPRMRVRDAVRREKHPVWVEAPHRAVDGQWFLMEDVERRARDPLFVERLSNRGFVDRLPARCVDEVGGGFSSSGVGPRLSSRGFLASSPHGSSQSLIPVGGWGDRPSPRQTPPRVHRLCKGRSKAAERPTLRVAWPRPIPFVPVR